MIGYALCGSFCTHAKSLTELEKLSESGFEIVPIMSDTVFNTDTRFGKAAELRSKITEICGHEIIHTIAGAEPFGPSNPLEALIIAPCTGNTLAKLANAVTDTPVCMAAKAHLRSDRPLLIALASNDALSANLSNIGKLLSRKNIFFVPMTEDDPDKKPHSLVADFTKIPICLKYAMNNSQIHPIFRTSDK